jgi:hypothetical protein
MWEMRDEYRISDRKPEGKKSLGRPGHGWENNSRMDLKEIELEDVNWIHLAEAKDQGQSVMNTIMNLWVPYKARKEISCPSEQPLAIQEGLCSMELACVHHNIHIPPNYDIT